MTRLLRVEVARFFARRVTRFVALGLLLGIAAAVIGIAVNSSRDVTAARQRAAAARDQAVAQQAAARQDCIAHVPPDQVDQDCPPDVTGALPPAAAFYSDPRFSFHDHLSDLLHAAVVIGALAALLLSASFIGAEWQAGTLATLLMWEPRRPRVAAAKVSAAVLGSLVVVVTAASLFLAGAALVAATRGTFGSVLQSGPTGSIGIDKPGSAGLGPDGPVVLATRHFAMHMWALTGRGALVVAFVAAVGAGLALLLRNTVAALGVVIGYFIAGEGIIGSLRHGDVRHHLVQSRLTALLDGTYSWMAPVRGVDGSVGFSDAHRRTVHAFAAGTELLALVALLLLLATVALQRRDVT